MAIGSFPIASHPIASFDRVLPSQQYTQDEKNILKFAQRVVYHHSNTDNLLTLHQDVLLYEETSPDDLLLFDQQTVTEASGDILELRQFVDPDPITHLDQFGFNLFLYINNLRIDNDQILENVSVTHSESKATTARFVLKTDNIEVLDQVGVKIRIEAQTQRGIYPIFNGICDVPELDIINDRMTYNCVQLREEIIKNKLNLSRIGSYNKILFGDDLTFEKELQERLTTTNKTIDLDNNDNIHITDLTPSQNYRYTITDSDVYYRNPTFSLISRAKLVNKATVQLNYSYTSLRIEKSLFEVKGHSFCDVNKSNGKKAFMNVQNLRSTIKGLSGWKHYGDINFTYLPKAGWYDCGQGRFGWKPWSGSNTQVRTRLDSNGKPIQEDYDTGNKDANGNPIYAKRDKTYAQPTTITNWRFAQATKASFRAAYRYSKQITEEQKIIVSNPESISKYALVESGNTYNFTVENTNENENYKSNINVGVDKREYGRALNLAYRIASNMIIQSHRVNNLTYETFLAPHLTTRDTIRANLTKVKGLFKITSIVHRINISTREASTSVIASGSLGTSSVNTTKPSFITLSHTPKKYTNSKYIIDLRKEDASFTMPSLRDDYGKSESESKTYNAYVSIPNSSLRVY